MKMAKSGKIKMCKNKLNTPTKLKDEKAATHLPEQYGMRDLLVHHPPLGRHPVGHCPFGINAVSVSEKKPRVEHRDADGIHLQNETDKSRRRQCYRQSRHRSNTTTQ